jgi:hypothetical protein
VLSGLLIIILKKNISESDREIMEEEGLARAVEMMQEDSGMGM